MQKILYSLFLLFLCVSAVHSQPPGKVIDPEQLKNGKYHALLFAVNEYDNYQNLNKPVPDAEKLEKVLRERYYFDDIRLVKNPTRSTFFKELRELKNRVGKDDNVMVFFAGHGYWKDENFGGYWWMRDTDPDYATGEQDWVSNGRVKAYLNDIECKHMLLVVDACFGGSFVRAGNINHAQKAHKLLYGRTSYTAMTSGNLTTVPDNSVFMRFFLQRLNENKEPYIAASEIFNSLRKQVINRVSGNVQPLYKPIPDSRDADGDFIFMLREEKGKTLTERVRTTPESNRGTDSPPKREEDLPPSQNLTLDLGSGQSMELVFVEGGTFKMGSNDGSSDEKPVHSVTLSDYYMGKYEVTQAQWRAVMGSNPSHFKNCDDCPVEMVSWEDVQEFCKKLSAKTGKNIALPTEAQWEFAARGGNKSRGYKYAGSNDIDAVAWYGYEKSGKKTHPVGRKRPNELGLYDMTGNVWEWCSDWYDSDYYKSSSSRNPAGPESGSYRVGRGGSWFDSTRDCRSAYRNHSYPDGRGGDIGFRLAVRP